MVDAEADEGKIEHEQDFNGEDEVQDWKIFSKIEKNQGVIPKRGDKDFQPDGTDIQANRLKESQDAMYNTLEESSHNRLRQVLVGIWIATEKKVLVPHAKGTFFKDIGKAVRINKHLQGNWINPIEAVYLAERGSMVIYSSNWEFDRLLLGHDEEAITYPEVGQPIPIGYLYVLAFGHDPGLYDKYQVYAYLKRFGYLVQDFRRLDTRTQGDKYEDYLKKKISFFDKIKLNFKKAFSYVFWLISSKFCNSDIDTDLYSKALQIGVLAPGPSGMHFRTMHYFNYTSVFETLKLIPSYRAFDSLRNCPPKKKQGYNLAFNVWKPYPNFSKNKPPPPDFQLCIINTEKQPFPRAQDFYYLFNELNFDFGNDSMVSEKALVSRKNTKTPKVLTKKEIRAHRREEKELRLDREERNRREYQRLRASKLKNGSSGRGLVLALIQNGVINYMEVREGDFNLEGPCLNDLDNLYNRNHGIVWNE